MSQHPLPALPQEDQDEVRLESRLEMHDQTGCERTCTLKGSRKTYALFDDTSEIDFRLSFCLDDEHRGLDPFLYPTEIPQVPLSPTAPAVAYGVQACCNSTGGSRRSQQDCVESGASHAPDRPDDPLGENSNDTALPHVLRRASCDAVCDYIPNTTADQPYFHCSSDADYDFRCDAPTDSDDEPSREALVRFADVHTVLCTPSPPTPPPHLILSSSSSLSSTPLRTKPYGPRIPPWGSTENLNRERRLRNDIRVLEDTLGERFDARDRLRKEKEAKNGKRRTEGEELRDFVLGIYPEMQAGQKERGCCLCVIM